MMITHRNPADDDECRFILVNIKDNSFIRIIAMTALVAHRSNERYARSGQPVRLYPEKEAVAAFASTAPLDLPAPPDELIGT